MTNYSTQWKYVTDCGDTNDIAIVDADEYTICNPSPMGHANAALICAAPDLLAALTWALDQIDDSLDPDHQEALAAARAAVAYASGAQ